MSHRLKQEMKGSVAAQCREIPASDLAEEKSQVISQCNSTVQLLSSGTRKQLSCVSLHQDLADDVVSEQSHSG